MREWHLRLAWGICGHPPGAGHGAVGSCGVRSVSDRTQAAVRAIVLGMLARLADSSRILCPSSPIRLFFPALDHTPTPLTAKRSSGGTYGKYAGIEKMKRAGVAVGPRPG